eukprot:symbB.v1.2.034619.t1/scaffold4497.1/size38912/1
MLFRAKPKAEQEKERAQVHDARLNAATSQLLNGIDTKIGSLEADRTGLSEQVEHLEMEIHHIHEAHLEDIQAHRRWHAESIEQTLEAASPSAFMALVCFRAWRNLLQDQASVRQRRAMCHRATESFCGTSHVALKRAFIGAWRNALQQIQQQRRSQTILRRALQRCDALAPEVLRRSSFLAWKLLTFTPTKALAWETIQKARKRVADGPPRELLRSSFQWWMSRAEQARGQRDEELQRAELLKQLELQSHEASAAQVAHQELLAQRLADAAEQMKALELTFQESQQHAEEVQQLQLAEEKQENTTLESKLSESEQRENDLRAEVARLADLLTAAECDSLEKASDFTNLQERYQESVAAQMELQRQEASVAGRLARVTQRVTEQEVDELRIALQAERAALLVLRREEVQSDLATTSSVRRSGASLPAMSPLQPRALDEVAKRWRLEHSHSVSAIYKSGTLPASLPVSGKLRGSGFTAAMALRGELRGPLAGCQPVLGGHYVARSRSHGSLAEPKGSSRTGSASTSLKALLPLCFMLPRRRRVPGRSRPHLLRALRSQAEPIPTTLPLADTDPWRLVIPALVASLVSFIIYPSVSLAVASLLDSVALDVIKGDVSQYMQNFFNFNTLLFSFFVSQTYASLYAQQESLYMALFSEISEDCLGGYFLD